MVSENNLFDNEQEIEKYSQLINEGETGVWVSYDGRYSKLPYSIEPFTKEGYGRNVGGYSEKKKYLLNTRITIINFSKLLFITHYTL